MCKKSLLLILVLSLPIFVGVLTRHHWSTVDPETQNSQPPAAAGTIVDRENDVPVYSNGEKPYTSHGKHFSEDGYYFGKRWQCVEFVKRYYYSRFHHRMPNGWGHAKSFFDPEVKHGEMNVLRGLVQYDNGKEEAPAAGDLLVYNHGEFGHVAIISKVSTDHVEIVQQNVAGLPRVLLPLEKTETGWNLGKENKPAGWLRLPSRLSQVK